MALLDGWNALTGEYEGLVKAGVLDPTKVVRTALTNAGSIAALMLTTEALVADITEEKKGSPAGGHGGMGDMYLELDTRSSERGRARSERLIQFRRVPQLGTTRIQMPEGWA